jgi:hypothetical protein
MCFFAPVQNENYEKRNYENVMPPDQSKEKYVKRKRGHAQQTESKTVCPSQYY